MTENRAVHILIFEGFADWEPSFALAELRRSGNRSVVTVGFDLAAVSSMGGLRVIPDKPLAEVRPADVELFIIPGGDLWEGEYPRGELNTLLSELAESKVPIAAICGGTLAIARAGLLNERAHTSNMPGYIDQHVPEYSGSAFYKQIAAVTDNGVISASGLSPVDFARQIFRQLEIFSAADDGLWFEMFKTGKIPQSTV